jgi:hypothetical protein
MTFPCIYVLYPKLVHPLHFSPFYLSPLIMVISAGLKILHSFLYRKYITNIYLLSFIPLSSLFCECLPFSVMCFHSCPLLRSLFIVQCDLCFSIIPVHVLHLSWYNPLQLHFLVLFPHPMLFDNFQLCFLVSCSCTDVIYFIFNYLSFLLFLFPWSPLPVSLLDMCSIYISMYILYCYCLYWDYIPHMRENMQLLAF